ncbi:MAG: mobile mystery protein A [Chloroflexota bacterium]
MSTIKAKGGALRRRQLDRLFAQLGSPRMIPLPRRGWIAEARNVLGMSTRQLAQRMHVSQPSLTGLERSEQRGTISLNSLRKAAQALNCRLVYAFVPDESFERLVREQAHTVARRMLNNVEHTMALEDQAIEARRQEEAIAEFADDLVRSLSRELWD